MNDELCSLLLALAGVRQSPKYHPEGDALFHSLQVFELARHATVDRVLWAAALFHDVGKAVGGADHDEIGAELLDGLLPDRAVWLVRHHLDLLRDARRARRRLHGTRALKELEHLRRWDLGGRDPRARVLAVEDALGVLFAIDDALMDPVPFTGGDGPFDSVDLAPSHVRFDNDGFPSDFTGEVDAFES